MSMRISTNMLFDKSIQSVLDNQADISDLQQQLSSGKKLLRPSDDPVGAAQVVRLDETLSKLTQYNRNNDLLKNTLEQEEAILRNMNNALNRARTLMIQAGNGILDTQDRAALGIEIGEIRDEVFDLMNSRNANGEYIFAGYQSQNPAFVFDPTAAGNRYIYQGDDGINKLQISESVSLQGNSSGKDVFEDVLARLTTTITGGTAASSAQEINQQSAFDTFHKTNYDAVTAANNDFRITINGAGNQATFTNIGTGANFGTFNFASGQPLNFNGIEFNITAGPGDTVDFTLDQPEKKNIAVTLDEFFGALNNANISDAGYKEALNDAIIGIDNGMVELANANSSLGGRMNVANSVFESNLDLEIANMSARSKIVDVDYAEAVSELSKQETALQAAQATFSRVTGLTLFDFIR